MSKFGDGGLSHTCTIDENGDVWIMGDLLGFGFNEIPKKVPNMHNIIQISCGDQHTLALSEVGEVYALGSNGHGQLGFGDQKTVDIPTIIQNIPQIQSIACGGFSSLIIDHENNPWGFGSNAENQLGLVLEEKSMRIPHQLTALKNIKIACCERYFSCFIDFNDKYYYCGQLIPSLTEIKLPEGKEIQTVVAGGTHCLILFHDGSVYIYHGKPETEFELIDFPRPVNSIACGNFFSLLLDCDGLVHYFQANKFEELKTITDGEFCPGNLVVAGCYHSLIRTIDGSIFTHGRSNFNQLGFKEVHSKLKKSVFSSIILHKHQDIGIIKILINFF